MKSCSATKLRALYQRKKGRDLFDLSFALKQSRTDRDRILAAFSTYMKRSGSSVSRSEFESNLEAKLDDPAFAEDLAPLLAPNVDWNPKDAARLVQKTLLSKL